MKSTFVLFPVVVLLALPAFASVETSFVVPAAAHAEGANGSVWTTDLVISNPTQLPSFREAVPAVVTIEMIPTGLAGSAAARRRVVLPEPLPPGGTIELPDVVGSRFPGVLLGALVVSGASASGEPVELAVSSRTWTPSPGGAPGSFGQGIPAERWSEAADRAGERRIVTGLEGSGRFRTNLGLVNLSPNRRLVLEVELFDAAGVSAGTREWTLEPWAHLQQNDVVGFFGRSGGGYTAVVRATSSEDLGVDPAEPRIAAFAVYGSRVDQRTNDPAWLAEADREERPRWDRAVVVPAAASTPGADGSHWTTDLFLFNPTAVAGTGDPLTVTIEAIPTGEGGSAADRRRVVLPEPLAAGGSLAIPDVLGASFPGVLAGAIVVTATGSAGLPAAIVVDSRTSTPMPEDATASYGQGIPGIVWSRRGDPAAGDGDLDRLVVPGLERSDAFRSNLGLVNGSPNVCLTLDVELLDSAGVSRGRLGRTLSPWAHLQINDLLGVLGLEGSGFTAVITLATADDLGLVPAGSHEPVFFAYGSRIDRRTNDPSTIAAFEPGGLVPGEPIAWNDFEGSKPWYGCPAEGSFPAEALVVPIFDRDWHWFGSENHREIGREVNLPRGRNWSQVGLRLKLECPTGMACDSWDRSGSIALVLDPEQPIGKRESLEIARHVTPYRMGMCEYVDLTPLAHLFVGRQTFESWIDTWVGPGSSSGAGWLISADLVFYPGPRGGADRVTNVWGRRSITLGYPDPPKDVDTQTPAERVPIPPRAKRVEARLVATGHSFGATLNCAEFCRMRQDLLVDGTSFSHDFWRGDCERNPVSPQSGTWQYDRNGWCPGAVAVGKRLDLTAAIEPGREASVDFDTRLYDGTEYVNTKKVDIDPYEWVSMQILTWE